MDLISADIFALGFDELGCQQYYPRDAGTGHLCTQLSRLGAVCGLWGSGWSTDRRLDGDLGSYLRAKNDGIVVLRLLNCWVIDSDWCQAFGRYAMGWWPSKIVVILNLIQMIGYSLIDCVIGGQILSAVSPHGSMSVAVGRSILLPSCSQLFGC